MQAPAEGFLYLACLYGGTGVEKPDFLAVVDAGLRVGELNVSLRRPPFLSSPTGRVSRIACDG